MDEEKKELGIRKFVVPIVAVSLFAIVLFGAGYAYFAATVSTNEVTNISASIPSATTSISTTSDPCVVVVTANQMAQAVNSTVNPVVDSNTEHHSTCHLNVTLNGAAGVKCSYNIVLVQTSGSATYTRTEGVGTAPNTKEFTGTIGVTMTDGATSGELGSTGINKAIFSTVSGNTIKGAETQMDSLVALENNVIAQATIELTADEQAVSHNYTLTENWYNIDLPQPTHSNKTYSYQLKAVDVVC